MVAYPAMAPLEQYLMPEDAEVALARSSAPASVSGEAEVMVLRRDGYAVVSEGNERLSVHRAAVMGEADGGC